MRRAKLDRGFGCLEGTAVLVREAVGGWVDQRRGLVKVSSGGGYIVIPCRVRELSMPPPAGHSPRPQSRELHHLAALTGASHWGHACFGLDPS